MIQRRGVVTVFVRLLFSLAALTLLRFAHVAWRDWQEHLSATLDPTADWEHWGLTIALLVGAGIAVAAATLTGRPRGYRWSIPFALTLPALIMLGHYVLLIELVTGSSTELPWILGHFFFYMDSTSQFVLGLIAGFGIGAGWRDENRGPDAPSPDS